MVKYGERNVTIVICCLHFFLIKVIRTQQFFRNDVENRNSKLNVFCKHLEVQGNYNVDLVSSILNIQGLSGKHHGDGHAKVIIGI